MRLSHVWDSHIFETLPCELQDFLRVPERKREADSALSSSSSSQPALEADETLPVLEASAVEAEPSWPSSSPSGRRRLAV